MNIDTGESGPSFDARARAELDGAQAEVERLRAEEAAANARVDQLRGDEQIGLATARDRFAAQRALAKLQDALGDAESRARAVERRIARERDERDRSIAAAARAKAEERRAAEADAAGAFRAEVVAFSHALERYVTDAPEHAVRARGLVADLRHAVGRAAKNL
jgi:hypothetical protein